jgi:CubicO group peptidase (beta-lactamase class C family)
VTGELYATWIRREVVEAAGLQETTPDVPVPHGALMAGGHSSRQPLGRRVVLRASQPTNALAAATGFVATAGDLARFFAQLDPAAATSLLTTASRREMTRAQWRNPHSELERHYGLGTMSSGRGDWWWFGHSGAFQGFISATAMVPAHGVTVAIVTNAIDGFANQWLAGALHVMATFAKHGAPTDAVCDWGGRWWSIWSTVDLVPMGAKVLLANPALLTPFSDASEIVPSSRDAGTIVVANGFGSHGEPVERVRGADGTVREIKLAGSTFVQEDRIAAELAAIEAAARR